MPTQNLNKLFSSPFYIDSKYAESFVPLFVGFLQGKFDMAKSEQAEVKVSNFAVGEEGGSEGSVAVVSIKSPIIKFSTYYVSGTRSIWSQINRLDQDPNIVGIVLDIDSGGGQVYGTPEFFDNIRNLQTPVVAYTDGLMCSAAYYIAAACDFIIANKRADAIGSIGAYAQFFDFSGFWEKHGAKMHTVYADKSTEKNKGYRDVLEGNYKTYISESLNPTVDTFIADMKSARPNLSEEVFKGNTWTGPEALKRNLVDALGSLGDAVSKAFELSSKNKSKTNTMSKPQSFPNLDKVLGSPVAEAESGSYLPAIEEALANNATALQAAQDAQAQAEADLQTETAARQADKEAHEASLAAEKESTVAAVTALRNAATLAGVEDLAEDASAEEIQTALTAQINVLNKKPGATHTTTGAEDKESAFPYIDFNSSIYQNK